MDETRTLRTPAELATWLRETPFSRATVVYHPSQLAEVRASLDAHGIRYSDGTSYAPNSAVTLAPAGARLLAPGHAAVRVDFGPDPLIELADSISRLVGSLAEYTRALESHTRTLARRIEGLERKIGARAATAQRTTEL